MRSETQDGKGHRGSSWRTHAPALVAGALVAVLLGYLRPTYMEHWDEIQLALGLEHFDLASHHPHPPGYYLFVVIGRVLNPLVEDPGDALRLVSVFASALMVGLVGWVFPRDLRATARSALLLAVAGFVVISPMILPFGIVALTYASEAACWLGILIWISRRPRGLELAGLLTFIGISSGLRQTLAIWGIAVLLLLTVRRRKSLTPRESIYAGCGFLLGVLVWFVPMFLEVGGWGKYSQATRSLLGRTLWSRSVFLAGLAPIVSFRLPQMLTDLWSALGPVLLLAIAAVAGRLHPRTRPMVARWDALPVGATVAFVFYLLLIYDSSGYILPAAIALAAYGFVGVAAITTALGPRMRLVACLGALVTTAGLVVVPGGLGSEQSSSYHRLLRHDEAMENRIVFLRREFDPEDTLIVTSRDNLAWGFRHAMYYLPEFTTLELVVDPAFVGTEPTTPYLVGRDRHIRHVGPYTLDVSTLPEFRPPDHLRNVVYMIGPDASRHLDTSCYSIARDFQIETGDVFWVLAVGDSVQVHVHRQRLTCAWEWRQ
jgi:hypothetical protein